MNSLLRCRSFTRAWTWPLSRSIPASKVTVPCRLYSCSRPKLGCSPATKIHVRGNVFGLPIGVDLIGGEAHDVTRYNELMDQRESEPGLMLADKGYDSDTIRQDVRDRDGVPEIPTKSNRKIQHSVSKPLYALRARIGCFIGHLKEQRRVATRYDKTSSSFLGFVLLGSIRRWIRFVRRA